MPDFAALSESLSDTRRRSDASVNWLQPVLLRLVAEGEPVAVADFAAAAGRPEPDVRTALADMPDTEFDEAGRVVGWGITQRRTPHRFDVNGRHLFTWCALDTLMFPATAPRQLAQAASKLLNPAEPSAGPAATCPGEGAAPGGPSRDDRLGHLTGERAIGELRPWLRHGRWSGARPSC